MSNKTLKQQLRNYQRIVATHMSKQPTSVLVLLTVEKSIYKFSSEQNAAKAYYALESLGMTVEVVESLLTNEWYVTVQLYPRDN